MSKLRKGLVLAAVLASCEPALVVGDVVCPPSEGGAPGIDANGAFTVCSTSSAAGTAGSGGTSAGTSPITSAGMGAASGETSGGMSAGGESTEVCPEGGAI